MLANKLDWYFLMILRKNTLWNLIGSGIPLLLGIFTIPYLMQKIGIESFGILTLVWALIGYFSLFDFGIGRALTQQISVILIVKQKESLQNIIKTGLWLTFVTGIIGGLVLALFAYPLGYKWLNVSQNLRESTYYCLLIAALGIPCTTLTSGFKGILEAYEDFRLANLLKILLGIANFGFPVVSIAFWGNRLDFIVVSLVFSRFVILVFHFFVVEKKIPFFRSQSVLEKKITKKLLSFGAWMTVSNIISPLMVTADRFIISSFLGASVLAYYTVPFEMLIRLLIIPAALTTSIFPRLSSLNYSDIYASKHLYQKSLKIVAISMFFVCIFVAISSYWGLKLWINKDFAHKSWAIASVLSFGILFNSIAQIPHAAIQAFGNIKAIAKVHLFEFILYLPVLILFIHFFGLIGAAFVWNLRVFVDLTVLLFIAHKNYQKQF